MPSTGGSPTRWSTSTSPTRSLDERIDILALMLRARLEDGGEVDNAAVADELLTLLVAGHETTASALAWTVERLRRHPEILRRLEADAEQSKVLVDIYRKMKAAVSVE